MSNENNFGNASIEDDGSLSIDMGSMSQKALDSFDINKPLSRFDFWMVCENIANTHLEYHSYSDKKAELEEQLSTVIEDNEDEIIDEMCEKTKKQAKRKKLYYTGIFAAAGFGLYLVCIIMSLLYLGEMFNLLCPFIVFEAAKIIYLLKSDSPEPLPRWAIKVGIALLIYTVIYELLHIVFLALMSVFAAIVYTVFMIASRLIADTIPIKFKQYRYSELDDFYTEQEENSPEYKQKLEEAIKKDEEETKLLHEETQKELEELKKSISKVKQAYKSQEKFTNYMLDLVRQSIIYDTDAENLYELEADIMHGINRKLLPAGDDTPYMPKEMYKDAFESYERERIEIRERMNRIAEKFESL